MTVTVRTARRSRAKPKPLKEGRLTLFPRDGNYHARGTIRHAGLKRRVRESLGVPYSAKHEEEARAAAHAVEERVRRELGGGVAPMSFAENALAFMSRPKDQPLGPSDVAAIKEMARFFGTRILRDISPAEFISFVDTRQKGNTSATRERYLNTVVAFLTDAISKGQYPEMPKFKRDKDARNPTKRARRKVAQVRPYLLALLLEASHIAIAAQLCAEAANGGRVSSVLFGCAREDLDMTPKAMTLTYHDTKNGLDVPTALPELSRPVFESFLLWREVQVRAGHVSDSNDTPLFLTPLGRPYKVNKHYTGTRNKTAFNAAKKRALVLLETRAAETIAAFEAAGDLTAATGARKQFAQDNRILKAFTQHWLRHKLATDLGRLDLRAAMKQGGWKDIRSVQGYLIDDAEFQRQAVENRVLFDTNLTRMEPGDEVK